MMMKKEDPNNETYMKALERYVRLTEIIQKHVREPECALCFLRQQVLQHIVAQYTPVTKRFEESKVFD